MKNFPFFAQSNFILFAFFCIFVSSGVSATPFAEKPPENESVKKLFARTVHLEPGVQGKPLPTNDWWTTLLANDGFPGRLYAYPFTVSANAQGVQIWYPLEWNQNGTEMDPGEPLVIEPIDPSPDSDPV